MISGTAHDNIGLAKIEVKLDDGNWTEADRLKNWALEVEGLETGKHTIIVKATDLAGNEELTAKEFKKISASQGLPGFTIVLILISTAFITVLIRRRGRSLWR